MADIVFITPNIDGYILDEPVGTLVLATILRNAGMDVEILQFYRFGNVDNFADFMEGAVKLVKEKAPKIVSFYTRCDTYHISMKLAQKIKTVFPQIYIVFGGPQADLSAEDTLRAAPYVDYICRGEGETTVVPFFCSLLSGKPDHSICGLAYHSQNEIIMNPKPEMIADLDTLHPIDYNFLNDMNRGIGPSVDNAFPVDVGRGCPFACTYCSTKSFWKRKYRIKSAERIIEEIKELHERFKVNRFVFLHDMFTLDRKKVVAVCKGLKQIGFPIAWSCSARVDCVDRELIDIMVDSGMCAIYMGIETGSPRMQKLVQKNLKLDDVMDKLSYIAQKGVRITASFIYGFPNETEEDFAKTMQLMLQLSSVPKIALQAHLCTFFSGTELTEQYFDQIERSTARSDLIGEYAIQECEDLIRQYPRLFPHFFEYKNELREKIKHFPQFFNCWMTLRPVYEYIANKYYTEDICQMLYDFSENNRKTLNDMPSLQKVLRQDDFLKSFCKDDELKLAEEIHRFVLWKHDAQLGSTEVFGFDVKAFMSGLAIEEIKPTISVVACVGVTDEDKRLKILSK